MKESEMKNHFKSSNMRTSQHALKVK